jgi:dUTPase
MGSAEIPPGRSVNVTTGLRLRSFRGQRARITQSVVSPGNKDKLRLCATLLAHDNHGADIEIKVTNYGCIPFAVCCGDRIAQIILIGVDDVECEVLTSPMQQRSTEDCLDSPSYALIASTVS